MFVPPAAVVRRTGDYEDRICVGSFRIVHPLLLRLASCTDRRVAAAAAANCDTQWCGARSLLAAQYCCSMKPVGWVYRCRQYHSIETDTRTYVDGQMDQMLNRLHSVFAVIINSDRLSSTATLNIAEATQRLIIYIFHACFAYNVLPPCVDLSCKTYSSRNSAWQKTWAPRRTAWKYVDLK